MTSLVCSVPFDAGMTWRRYNYFPVSGLPGNVKIAGTRSEGLPEAVETALARRTVYSENMESDVEVL